MQADPVIFSLTPDGADLAAAIASAIGGTLATPVPGQVGTEIRTAFAAGRPLVGICAAGILIRSLSGQIADKWAEPPVVAVAEDGTSVVPLLGGHHGANDLARLIAAAIDGHAAITTAGDVRIGVALDAPPAGWRLENPQDAKSVAAALIGGQRGTLSGHAPWLEHLPPSVVRQPAPGAHAPVVLTAGKAHLIYRRQTLALGVGCARACPPDELLALVRTTLADNGLSEFELAGIWSIDLKADERAIHDLAGTLGVPARFFPPDILEAETPRLANPSDIVFEEVGCHGVAEGAALAAGGPDAMLEVAKTKSANATCAVARLGAGGAGGRLRGRLAVIGIGPGGADWRTPEASRHVAEADELVGYGLYIDLLGAAARGKPRKDFPLGGEEDRCRYALERAGEGCNVALVCSGDAGIYAMGALVAELLDTGGISDAARRVEVVNVPGISALQAASARSGALLGHDFCAISLSDLLTPRATIVARVEAAAAGDFVIAFYNPVSKRRRELLDMARQTLLKHRPADTPVLLASNLGRPDEQLRPRTLGTLHTDEVDMLTVVLVGASTSRAFRTGDMGAGAEGSVLYTPRGYAAKRERQVS